MIFLSLGFATSKYKYNRFISSGNEALEDFKTLVTVDYDRRVIISCRRSSLAFLGETLLWGFVIVIVFRALVKLGYWVFGLGGGGYGSGVFVSRRDGSLAGREVVVEKRRFKEREGKKKGFNFKVPINPLSPSRDVVKLGSEAALRRPQKHALEGEKLPKWWPDFVPASSVVSGNDNQELQKEANRVIRVDFVLNYCSSSKAALPLHKLMGRMHQFVLCLADSIGLQNVHTATIVSTKIAQDGHIHVFLQAQELRQKMMSEYKEMVGRSYFTVTGERLEEDVIEKIITNGEEGVGLMHDSSLQDCISEKIKQETPSQYIVSSNRDSDASYGTNCPSSSLGSPGTPHAWPSLLGVMYWLVQIAQYSDHNW
ncbi:hypothetical protein IFM89_024485 [Coptis chinensis]|uniref:Syntaxin N-terminal domain-containing protein n=1 Tax=Coptis chinensis TaxID=261450 RepID=A0A835HB15_9MAGN|nr:hypothetical protein IFM89_024485 [Coptis chinensis]